MTGGGWNDFGAINVSWTCLTIVFFSICYRSMHKLAQLERLDLGNNEFSELVSECIF